MWVEKIRGPEYFTTRQWSFGFQVHPKISLIGLLNAGFTEPSTSQMGALQDEIRITIDYIIWYYIYTQLYIYISIHPTESIYLYLQISIHYVYIYYSLLYDICRFTAVYHSAIWCLSPCHKAPKVVPEVTRQTLRHGAATVGGWS